MCAKAGNAAGECRFPLLKHSDKQRVRVQRPGVQSGTVISQVGKLSLSRGDGTCLGSQGTKLEQEVELEALPLHQPCDPARHGLSHGPLPGSSSAV